MLHPSAPDPGHTGDRRPRRMRQVLALLLGTIVVDVVPALAAVPTDLPPLVAPASGEHHPGKLVFAELVTPDLVAAERFYESLFGWSFQNITTEAGFFGQASLNGQTVAGILQRPLAAGRRPSWVSFIATADMDKAEALAVQNGAKLLLRSQSLAHLGQGAVLADPQGAVFAMLASDSGDPPDLLADPGDWIWSSLVTTDPQTAAAFYGTVFGDQVFGLPDASDARHLILASDGYARASVNPFPVGWTNPRSRWISYVRVDDAAATADRVTALGGNVVLPPHPDRHGGRIALVADPAGALFGLLEWSTTAATGNAQ